MSTITEGVKSFLWMCATVYAALMMMATLLATIMALVHCIAEGETAFIPLALVGIPVLVLLGRLTVWCGSNS